MAAPPGLDDAAKQGGQDPPQVLAEVQQRREDGADLDDRGERRYVGVVDGVAEQFLQDRQMSGTRYRQELRQSLDRTEKRRLQDVHAHPSPQALLIPLQRFVTFRHRATAYGDSPRRFSRHRVDDPSAGRSPVPAALQHISAKIN